jgi:hypothetical protein
MTRRLGLAILLMTIGCASVPSAERTAAPRLRITLSSTISDRPISGHLIVFMSRDLQPRAELDLEIMEPESFWVTADDVRGLAPGGTIELDPDRLALRPWSAAPLGDHQLMALLDRDGSYPYEGIAPGDLRSAVVRHTLTAAPDRTIDLRLDRVVPPRPKVEHERAREIEIESALLTTFYGRPMKLRAVLDFPVSDPKVPNRRYPVAYRISGIHGTHEACLRRARARAEVATGTTAQIVMACVSGVMAAGHHMFADSVNTGPWARAFVEELIPAIEKQFPVVAKPNARFLSGHSSGGWAVIWLQIQYPELFGGAWGTAPDPVDFQSFSGIDVRPGSTENFYRTKEGRPRNLVRDKGRNLYSFQEFARLEQIAGGPLGLSTFDWVFSPRADGGGPMWLWDRATGDQNPDVQKAWERFDIRKILEARWSELAPKLRGKLHLSVGELDNFHSEEALRLLCDFFKERKLDAECEVVPGRAHFDLRDEAFEKQMIEKMLEVFSGQKSQRHSSAPTDSSVAEKTTLSPISPNQPGKEP